MDFGALLHDPKTQASATDALRRRDARVKIYEQLPSSLFERYPMTKIMMSSKAKPSINPKREWAGMAYDKMAGTVLGAYDTLTVDTVSTAVGATDANAAGTTQYLTMADTEAMNVRPQAILELYSLNDGYHLMVDVVSVLDASNVADVSVVTVKLLENDTNNVLGDVAGGNLVYTVGPMAVPEGSALVDGYNVEPTTFYNYTEILQDAWAMTGSEETNLQVFGDKNQLQDMATRSLDRLHRQMERLFWMGIRVKTTGTTGVRTAGTLRTGDRYMTGGFRYFLEQHAPTNIVNVSRCSTFDDFRGEGRSWMDKGAEFLYACADRTKKYGVPSKRLLVSDYGYGVITDALLSSANVNIGATFKDKWGFEVTSIDRLGVKFTMQVVSDWSTNPAWKKRMAIIDPAACKAYTKQNRDLTIIKPGTANVDGFQWVDAKKGGWFIDLGCEFDNLEGQMLIDGIGDNFA